MKRFALRTRDDLGDGAYHHGCGVPAAVVVIMVTAMVSGVMVHMCMGMVIMNMLMAMASQCCAYNAICERSKVIALPMGVSLARLYSPSPPR